MPNGFEVYSDSGKIQASDKHYDLSRSSFQSFSGSLVFYDKIYAIEPDNMKSVNVKFVTAPPVLTQAVQGDGTLHIFKFGHVPVGSMGIEVYDESGLLTFCSDLRSCNVIDFIDVPDYTSMGTTGDILFSKDYGVARFAIIPIRIPFFALSAEPYANYHLGTIGFIRNGSQLRVERVISVYNNLPYGIPFVYPKRLSFAVIDVTNF